MTKTKARLISAGIAILLLATALFVLLRVSPLQTAEFWAKWDIAKERATIFTQTYRLKRI